MVRFFTGFIGLVAQWFSMLTGRWLSGSNETYNDLGSINYAEY